MVKSPADYWSCSPPPIYTLKPLWRGLSASVRVFVFSVWEFLTSLGQARLNLLDLLQSGSCFPSCTCCIKRAWVMFGWPAGQRVRVTPIQPWLWPGQTSAIFQNRLVHFCIFLRMYLIGVFVRAPETGSWKAPKYELCHTVPIWGEVGGRGGGWPNNLYVLCNMDTHRTLSSEGLGSPCHRCQLQIIAVITECCDWSTIVSEAMFRNQWDPVSEGSTTDILWCLYGRWSADHIKIKLLISEVVHYYCLLGDFAWKKKRSNKLILQMVGK